MLDGDDEVILVDVRDARGIPGGTHPRGDPDAAFRPRRPTRRPSLPDLDAKIIVYCRSGNRSAQAATLLDGLGYTRIYDMGGIIDWPYETTAE
ncbi:MAG: rhodanese-like domain-containing protein [Comamonadaceae bacterium]|nr:rhodanese-like domain-containing protein [Comamonadaceae bacterium]